MSKLVKVSTIEPYTKELKRKEYRESPYRIFKYPNLTSAYIVAKDDIVLGLCSLYSLKETFKYAKVYPENAYSQLERHLVKFIF